MEQQELDNLQKYQWMESRIPVRDALSVFVPDTSPCPKSVEEMTRTGESRWYPKPGGHQVIILHAGRKYDASIFPWKREHGVSTSACIALTVLRPWNYVM